MKTAHRKLVALFCGLFLPVLNFAFSAEVTVTELEDRVRFEIDGELFTEWRHGDWMAPYFYPVIGPHGKSVTRHFPMKSGVEEESQDHPHHRSLRFAHSKVNGANFWYWRPGREREFSAAEIKLDKVEKTTSGKTGELVATTRWINDGETVLNETMRFVVTPLENGEKLIDYDVELKAGGNPVIFGDSKDGGLFIRVAGSMKARQHHKMGGEKLSGTIKNSHGDINEAAWGKRADWVDFSGPDPSGEIAGIAMFDHPENLRYPTYWHARTYGLLAANRFGQSQFDKTAEEGAGNYTLPAGKTLRLRHRIYIHRGNSDEANVASQYQAYLKSTAVKKPKPMYPAEIKKITYHSTADDTEQPALYRAPDQDDPVPLLVALHTWSGGYRQAGSQLPLAEWCLQENWAFIHPHFRGPNWTPDAMGSELMVKDIISAVQYAKANANIDENRIYCVGVSGGGHASLLMAARAPEIWAGVSAWCGISDIETWHRQCDNTKYERYAEHIEKALGGRPENSEEALRRSPNYWLEKRREQLPPLDIWHGVRDGRAGSVPFTHSLLAWNHAVPEEVRLDLKMIEKVYAEPSFEPVDLPKAEDRDVLFQKSHGNIRVSIFEGGHEILQEAALNWLAAQEKGEPVKWSSSEYKKLSTNQSNTESGQ